MNPDVKNKITAEKPLRENKTKFYKDPYILLLLLLSSYFSLSLLFRDVVFLISRVSTFYKNNNNRSLVKRTYQNYTLFEQVEVKMLFNSIFIGYVYDT